MTVKIVGVRFPVEARDLFGLPGVGGTPGLGHMLAWLAERFVDLGQDLCRLGLEKVRDLLAEAHRHVMIVLEHGTSFASCNTRVVLSACLTRVRLDRCPRKHLYNHRSIS